MITQRPLSLVIQALKRGSFPLVTAAVLLCAGCSDDTLVAPDLPPSERAVRADAAADLASGPAHRSRRGGHTVTVPFKARFYTDLAGLRPDPSCGDPLEGRFLNTQEGIGEATHLGRFSVRITFCVDATDLLDDGQLTAGESVPYDNGVGTLTAANGDELWIAVAGAVLPSDHPDYDFEFADPFTFTGGTGRFQGAGGGGVTNSLVDAAVDRTTHRWSGTLTLRPGR